MNDKTYNSSILSDKDITFFGNASFPINNTLSKDFTKNSSNPEKVYKELNSEITKIREGNNKIDLNSSNSRNNDYTLNEQSIDVKIWSNENNETQDSNQYFKKYESLKENENKKTEKLVEKITDKRKEKISNINSTYKSNKPVIKKSNIQFIPNNNYDYSADTDEYGNTNIPDELEMVNTINYISSMQIKNNNINQIDKNSLKYLNIKFNNMSVNNPAANNCNNRCFTEPDELYHYRFNNNNSPHMINTPNKRETQNINFGNNIFIRGNYDSNGGKASNVFNRISCSVNSNKSTNYSSNNKKNYFANYEEENDLSLELNEVSSEEPFVNTVLNTVYHPRSDRKVYLHTSESIESNNSLQYRANPNFPKINLNSQFTSWNNGNIYLDEETRKTFSSSFNERSSSSSNNINSSNLEPTFSINKNIPKTCSQIELIKQNKSRLENILANCKLTENKKFINLDDILYGLDKRTTIMIRNVPIRYTDQTLLEELEEFKGKFDCLYLPYDYEKNGNRGYAFINFTHSLHILLFYEKFEGKSWNFFDSKKRVELNRAKFEGISEIKRHARNYKEKKPIFFLIKDMFYNLEIPSKFANQFMLYYQNVIFEEGQHGGIIIKSFGKNKFI